MGCSPNTNSFDCGCAGMVWEDLPDLNTTLSGKDGTSAIVLVNDFTTYNHSNDIYTAFDTTLTNAQVLDNNGDKYRISGILGCTSNTVKDPSNTYFDLMLDSQVIFRYVYERISGSTFYVYYECYITRTSSTQALCDCKIFTNQPDATNYYQIYATSGIPYRNVSITWDTDLDVKLRMTKYDTGGTIDYYNTCIEKIEIV